MEKIVGYKLVDQELIPITSDSPEHQLPDVSSAGGSNLKNFWEVDTTQLLSNSLGVDIEMSSFFNALHSVSFGYGQEGDVHQHSYHLKVRARGTYGENNIVTPFADVRQILNKISSIYEGKLLNELPPFTDKQPTTENFVAVIAHQIMFMAQNLNIHVIEVSLYESPTTGITIVLSHG